MTPDPMLINDGDGPTQLTQPGTDHRVDAAVGEHWSDWSVALQVAVSSMFWRDFREQGLWRVKSLQALDAGFCGTCASRTYAIPSGLQTVLTGQRPASSASKGSGSSSLDLES